MSDPQSFLIATRTVPSLYRFVKNGGIAEAIARIELMAAHTSLLKVAIANNKDAQLWTTIGHLESALHDTLDAITSSSNDHVKLALFGESFFAYIEGLKQQGYYISIIMSILYLYLKEYELSRDQGGYLEKIHSIDASQFGLFVNAIGSHATRITTLIHRAANFLNSDGPGLLYEDARKIQMQIDWLRD